MLFQKGQIYNKRLSIGILVSSCILCLAPFIDKAFNIDDPLFVWVAKQIHANPFDFYGFSVNWYGVEMPVSDITKNPPLASYYIALIAYWFGWSEVALHAAFLIPACAVVLGTYLLALEFCQRPLLAALAGMVTPVFLLSATSVMCDVLMLSLWVFSVYCWRRGILVNSYGYLLTASVLITACSLTKYFGMALIPLLIAYSVVEKKKIGIWVVFISFPIVILVCYQWITYVLYGKGLLLDAGAYAMSFRKTFNVEIISNVVNGLSFIGGCILIALFYAPILWKIGRMLISLLLIAMILLLLMRYELLIDYPIAGADGINWLFVCQLPLFVTAGVFFLFITVSDLLKNRDADSMLIFMWVTGTFIFTSLINWSVNGRSILPIVPVAGILVVRGLEQSQRSRRLQTQWFLYIPLVPVLLIALLVTRSDYRSANISRTAAMTIHEIYKKIPATMWFEGHWGFQYYMDKIGGVKAIDYEKPTLLKGDFVVIPSNNTHLKPVYNYMGTLIGNFNYDAVGFLTTMSKKSGAGFYSDIAGPLPFAFTSENSENFNVYRLLINKKTRFN